MTEKGTLEGEVEDGLRRFWALQWKWRGLVLAGVVGLFILLGIWADDGEPTDPACDGSGVPDCWFLP